VSFIGELRRRNVFKVGAAYAIVAWLIAQVVNVINEPLGLPDRFDTAVIVLLAIGFPIALVLAWAYEVTPEGIKRTQEVPPGESIRHVTGQKLNYVVTTLLVLAVGLMALDNYVLDDRAPAAGTAAAAPDAGAAAATAAAGGRLPNSVAVLPFESLSADRDDAYITAGIHEEILNQLVQLGSLSAISRTTMMRYADSSKSIPEIARELNVESVIEGSVRRAGNRVLVTVQLIDPETDLHLWSESYERDLTDVFAIQADIATNVARELEVELSAPEQEQLAREAPTDSQEAYELYLAAVGMAESATSDVQGTIERLERAVELDPEFFDAWVAKAGAHSVASGISSDAQGQRDAAVAAASRAIELDPASGTGHAVLAFALTTQGDWSRAHEEFERARALGVTEPYSAAYSTQLMAVGDFAGARDLLQAGLAVDPMNDAAAGFLLAAYEMTGDHAARSAGYERGETLFGAWLGDNLELLLRLGENDTEFLRGPVGRLGVGQPIHRAAQPYIGASEAGLEAIRTAYADASNPSPVALMFMAAWTAYFGDPVFASHLAEEAVGRQKSMIYYFWLPLFEDVRRVPEFKDVVRDLGLVDYWREYGWPPFCRPLDGEDFSCA
jgi:TolB-like protein